MMSARVIFACLLVASATAMTECEKHASKRILLGGYRPQCDENGLYSRLQYHGSTGHRWCVDPETGAELLNSRRGPSEATPDCEALAGKGVHSEASQCQEQASQPALLGAFRPQCNDDGTYSKLQCHGSTGHCWCVDPLSGVELLNTRRGPSEERVNCDAAEAAPATPTKCQQLVANGPRLIGAYVPQCRDDGSFSPMQCHGSTGHCWCVNEDGLELQGTRLHATAGRPDCGPSKKTVSADETRSMSPCEQLADAPALLGAFRPQCTEDGHFAEMQYHGSTGHRWCVDPKTGLELENTRRGPSEPNPDCDATARVPYDEPSPCELRASQPLLLGAFRPQCQENGLYTPLQCHGSTGHCFCVSEETGAELEGTRKAPGEGMPDCDKVPTMPAPMSPCEMLAAKHTHFVGAFTYQCLPDGSFSPIQCHGSTGYCWCVNDEGHELEGTRQGPTEARPDCSPEVRVQSVLDEPEAPVFETTPTVAECYDFCEVQYPDLEDLPGWQVLAQYTCKKGCQSAAGLAPCGLAQTETEGVCYQEGDSCISFCADTNPFTQAYSYPCEVGVFYQMHHSLVTPHSDRTPFGPSDCVKDTTPTPCQDQSNAPLVPGAYRPQCTEDGLFAEMQYHGSTGHRWCVDKETGIELEGSRVGPGLANPDCASYVRQPFAEITPCREQEAQPLLLGAYRPQCQDNGKYAPLQCHGSTGHCFCVDEETGAELEGTRKAPGQGMPDCKDATAEEEVELTRCQQLTAARTGFLGAYVPQCLEDGSFSPMQCHGSTGHCWCVNEDGLELEATRKHVSEGRPNCDAAPAPPLTPCQELAAVPVLPGAYRPQCTEDGLFAEMQYHGSTGHRWCVDKETGVELEGSRVGPGLASPDCASYRAPHLPKSRCQELSARPALIGAFRPQCDEDGLFSSLQCHGSTGHCWCVDVLSGEELANTWVGPGEAMPDCEAAERESAPVADSASKSDDHLAVKVGVGALGAVALVGAIVIVSKKPKKVSPSKEGYRNAEGAHV